jgi:hypothetical protein
VKPSPAKARLLPHTGYHTTKEPPIASRICFNDDTRDNYPDRLFKSKPFIEHVRVGVLLMYLEVADFDAQAYLRDSGGIIHPSDVDGSPVGARRR